MNGLTKDELQRRSTFIPRWVVVVENNAGAMCPVYAGNNEHIKNHMEASARELKFNVVVVEQGLSYDPQA